MFPETGPDLWNSSSGVICFFRRWSPGGVTVVGLVTVFPLSGVRVVSKLEFTYSSVLSAVFFSKSNFFSNSLY